MPRNVVGRPAQGDDFFGRETEQRQIWQRLNDGNNILLLAPRRVGKTSLLYHLRKNAWNQGWLAAYGSVADARSETKFLEQLIRTIAQLDEGKKALATLKQGRWKPYFNHIRGALDEISLGELGVKLRELPAEDWRPLAQDLRHALSLVKRQWVIMLDEVPVFVMKLLREDPTGTRARDFLTAFREIRQGDPLRDDDPVHWILAGSVGLDNLARRHGLTGTINDCPPFEIGAFDIEEADRLLQALGSTADIQLSDEVRSHLCARAERLIPHHLQLLFASLREGCDDLGEPPSIVHVDRAFETVLGHGYRSYFDHWSVRLEEELGPVEAAQARELLTVVSRDSAGATREVLSQALTSLLPDANSRAEALSWLLDVLAREGYLIEESGRWRFRSPLLREYWRRRFDP